MSGFAGYYRGDAFVRCNSIATDTATGRTYWCDLPLGHEFPDKYGGSAAHAQHDDDGRFLYGWGDLSTT